MSADPAKTAMITWLETRLERHQAIIAAFVAELQRDPGGAMNNCDSAFTSSAALGACRYALKMLNGKSTVEDLRTVAVGHVVDKASIPRRSTSETSNIYDRCVARAWADIVDAIKWQVP